jgi:hypothetical protein
VFAKLLLLGVWACGNTSEPPGSAAPPPAPPEKPVPPTSAVAPAHVTVRWQNVTRTDGCFFFSGPEGRDDQLVGDVRVETVEREGERLSLRIGTAVFEGTYARGVLELARTHSYEFEGAWQTTERIRGAMRGTLLSAQYTYEECKVSDKICPGRCTVQGELVFSRGL